MVGVTQSTFFEIMHLGFITFCFTKNSTCYSLFNRNENQLKLASLNIKYIPTKPVIFFDSSYFL